VSRPVYVGGLGFSMKWNMGWMHDTLAYFAHDPVHRKFHHDKLTFGHDLRVHRELHAAAVARRGRARQALAARQDARRRLAEVREPAAALRVSCTRSPGKKLLFMGGEFGQLGVLVRQRTA
jgi:1,4-alpha-glucan branching enzyme